MTAIDKAIAALERVGICVNIETVHDAIDEALGHLTALKSMTGWGSFIGAAGATHWQPLPQPPITQKDEA